MAKYKNISKFKLFLINEGNLLAVQPNQEINLLSAPPNFQRFLVEVIDESVDLKNPKPKRKTKPFEED